LREKKAIQIVEIEYWMQVLTVFLHYFAFFDPAQTLAGRSRSAHHPP
jgi:hypothetical protein